MHERGKNNRTLNALYIYNVIFYMKIQNTTNSSMVFTHFSINNPLTNNQRSRKGVMNLIFLMYYKT